MLKPPGRYGPGSHLGWIDEVGLSDKVREAHKVEPAKPIQHYWGSKNAEQHWFHYKVTSDIRFLVDSYKRVCEWFSSHDWLNTGAMPSMDRNPLPRASLIRARIPTLVAIRHSIPLKWRPYLPQNVTRA